MPRLSQLLGQAGTNAGVVIERMLSQNTLVLLRFALCPSLGKLRKQLDLSLKAESPAILRLNPVGQLVINRQTERDALKNAAKQIVRLTSSKSIQHLSTLDYDKVITMRINLDMRTSKILRVAIRRQCVISRRSNHSCQSVNVCFDFGKRFHGALAQNAVKTANDPKLSHADGRVASQAQ